MPKTHRTETAIIGAGIVGLACAHALSDAGQEVMLIDPAAPGSGASYGNASSISPHAISPVCSPAVLRSLPDLLFNRESPLSIRLPYLPSLTPWLLQFIMQGLPKATERNLRAMAELQTGSMPAWRDLAGKIDLSDLLVEQGVLYTYPDEASFTAAQGMVALRRGYGIPQDVLSARQVADLEPNLPACAGAVHHVGSIHLADTGEATRRIADAAAKQGVTILAAGVSGLVREPSGVVLHAGEDRILARRVIIAAGAHSAKLARQAGDRVPLVAHRGYHVEFDMDEPPVSRPVHRTQLGYYMTPMRGRLRAAGTVELASNDAAPSPRRFDQIERGVRATFPDMPPVARRWMGLRPAMPDSLPVIGASSGGADVIYAFGHGHVGLTLGPVTAQLVKALATGRPAPEVLRHFSPQRFGLFGKRASAGAG